jgi:hypothetical protein
LKTPRRREAAGAKFNCGHSGWRRWGKVALQREASSDQRLMLVEPAAEPLAEADASACETASL